MLKGQSNINDKLTSLYKKLNNYLLTDGFYIDSSNKELEYELNKYKALYSISRFIINSFTNVHMHKTHSFNSDTDSEEFKKIWMSIKKLTPLVFHKFMFGSIYTAIIIPADDLSSKEIDEVIVITEKSALNSIRFVVHSKTLLFIKQRMGLISVELFFVFSDSKKAKNFRKNYLNKSARNHRLKGCFVNSCVIDVSASDVVTNKRPIGMFQGNRGKKLRNALF